MSHCKSIVFVLSSFSLAGVLVASQGVAQAQPANLTIDSSTGVAPEPPSAPSVSSSAPAAAAPGGEEPADNAFYGEYLEDADLEDDGRTHSGTVPTVHTVVTGDTLWDLSAYYFSNAWNWPKVWKLNPEIADPHWIYPGNIVRLREGGKDLPVAAQNNQDNGIDTPGPLIRGPQGYGLRQTAYVDLKDLEDAGIVSGSIAEKSLLAVGDSVYISYGDKLPEVGTVFPVYGTGTKIKRGGKKVGEYVEVAGELQITFAKEGKRARGTITRSVDPIERGMRIGPLALNFKEAGRVTTDTKIDGSIVGVIGPDELIGAEHAVIIDRGTKDGVQVGNRLFVVRSGDAYSSVMEPGTNVGQDDDKYPVRAIGEIQVLQAGEQASLGVVSFSIHELGVGDRVYIGKGQ